MHGGRPKPKTERKEVKTFRLEIKKLDDYWNKLLWVMAEGNPTSMMAYGRMDLHAFYSLLEVHEDIIDKRLKQFEEQRVKNKRTNKKR